LNRLAGDIVISSINIPDADRTVSTSRVEKLSTNEGAQGGNTSSSNSMCLNLEVRAILRLLRLSEHDSTILSSSDDTVRLSLNARSS
jgi:hypothetical protein